MVKRILIACAIVVLCSAGGTAVFVVEQVHSLSEALKQNGALKTGGTLASAAWGDPQTLLLVGDDQRSLTQYYHRAVPHLANEMLLVRIDPSKPYISMMSIPRELWVTIHPPGQPAYTNRLNSAYTHGIGVLVSTIKRVIGLPVNHVIVITFGRFKRAVDEMGCVYSTVDRRYFHVNVPGGEQYQEIDLQPGYQKLCGVQSLQFVSYRHGDTSLVRDARDQSFLLDVKKQYGPTLVDNSGKFEHIFGRAVQTDPGLQSNTGLLNLLGTLISSSGRRVRQVHFQANLLPSYDTATPQQIHASVNAFLHGGSSVPKRSTAAAAHAVRSHKVVSGLPLQPTGGAQLAKARSTAAGVPFPLEYPRVQERAGSSVPPAVRAYLIHGTDGKPYPIYDAVFFAGPLGQFYDVQGTTWTQAPQFASPEQTVHVGGRTYSLYYEGSNLKMVAWFEHGAAYWIRNSLSDAVANGDLLAIAEQTRTVGTTPGGLLHLNGAGVPIQASPPKKTTTMETVGSIGGLLTLVAVPILAFLALRRRRELTGVRAQFSSVVERGARLPTASLPFEPGSAAARAAERARLAAHAGPEPRVPPEVRRREAEHRLTVRRRVVRLGALAAVIAIAAVAFVVAGGGGSAPSRKPATPRVQAGPPPTVPVGVLNAGAQQGAAKTLADQLRGEHVNIGTVGNVTEARPPGVEILYAPGQNAQASRLAKLLSARAPTVAPIDPSAAAAAGSSAQLVVVIG
jgi:LCP family protein required for cell wall assembly